MSLDLVFVFRVLVFPGFSFLLIFTLFCDWIERKIEARMQNRIGPSFTGRGGILQPLADIVKLLTKEDVTPRDARRVLFKISPILAFSLLIFAMFFLPVDGANVILDSGFEGDLIFVLILISMANFFLFLSGWASRNPYSEIGSARTLTQLLGYDIPLFILAIAPAFFADDLSISNIISKQQLPFILFIPWVFVMFIITLQAELEKDPFDIPHAETEIVGGYETEYGGRNLAFLKLAKDVQIVLGAAIVVELFLGGYGGPVFFDLPQLWYTIWFILKVLIVVVITEYLTCVFARLRLDQVLNYNWKILMPLSIVSLVATILVKIWLIPG